jgi:hypothetical protein
MLTDMSRKTALNALIVALFVAYAAQLHSPLRLAGDSPVYLCDATDLAKGRGFNDDHLPPGYPHVLAVLNLIGLGTSGGIVALNLVSMAVGLVCISNVLRREFGLSKREINTICLLACCSWLWVQLVTFPLTDLLFFALSSMVLATLSLAKERSTLQAVVYVAAAAVLAAAAYFVRTIGAALFVAVAVAALETQAVRRFLGRRSAIVLLTVGVGLAAGLGLAHRNRIASPWYAGALSYLNAPHPWRTSEEITWWRIGEVGELAQNVSSTAFAPTTATLPIDSVSPSVMITLQLRSVRVVVGGVALVLILAGMWSRRRQFSPVEGYFLAYVGILFIWPFDDTRFLAPILPLLLAWGWLGLRSLMPDPQKLRQFAVTYSAIFCVFGALAMCDSLRVTFLERQRPWQECGSYVADIPAWLSAFDQYGGVRPKLDAGRGRAQRVVPP